MSRLSQLPSDSVCDVWIRAGTASRIWNPLERNNPPALRAGSGFDRRGPREHVISGRSLGWSTTVKTRPDESQLRDVTGLVLRAIVVVT
jgi:hypothetical protein